MHISLLGMESVHGQKRQEPGQCGFGTLIEIRTVRRKTVAAASGRIVIERFIQVVLSQKPVERGQCGIAVLVPERHAEREQTGFEHCLCLDRLLIEAGFGFAADKPAVVSDRGVVIVGDLQVDEPVEDFQPQFGQLRPDFPLPGEEERLGNLGIRVRKGVLEPGPGSVERFGEEGIQAVGEHAPNTANFRIAGKAREVGVNADERKRDGTGIGQGRMERQGLMKEPGRERGATLVPGQGRTDTEGLDGSALTVFGAFLLKPVPVKTHEVPEPAGLLIPGVLDE